MVQQGHIDHLLQETGQILRPTSLVHQAFLKYDDSEYYMSV